MVCCSIFCTQPQNTRAQATRLARLCTCCPATSNMDVGGCGFPARRPSCSRRRRPASRSLYLRLRYMRLRCGHLLSAMAQEARWTMDICIRTTRRTPVECRPTLFRPIRPQVEPSRRLLPLNGDVLRSVEVCPPRSRGLDVGTVCMFHVKQGSKRCPRLIGKDVSAAFDGAECSTLRAPQTSGPQRLAKVPYESSRRRFAWHAAATARMCCSIKKISVADI